MTVKKVLLFILAVFLLLMLDMAAITWYFYQRVYTFPLEGDITQLGGEYRNADVLDRFVDSVNEYFLVKLPSGETRLLYMEGSVYCPGRYRYRPDTAVSVPEERPYECTVSILNRTYIVRVGADDKLALVAGGSNGETMLESVHRTLPFALLALELLVWWLVSHFSGCLFAAKRLRRNNKLYDNKSVK